MSGPDFQTADLGRVFQVAEAVKGMRRQSTTDALRDRYLGQQIDSAASGEKRAAETHAADQASRLSKRDYLLAEAIERAPDPVAAMREYQPEFIADFDKQYGAGAFEKLDPARVKAIAGQIKQRSAAAAGVSLNGTPEQQFQAGEAQKARDQAFSNNKTLAAIQHKYSMEEERVKAEAAAGRAAKTEGHKVFRDTQALRKEFENMDVVKNYKTTLQLYERAANAPNTRAGDVSLIYALGKMFDPTSVVREGELILAKDAAPWLRKIVSNAQSQVTGRGAIDPETRSDILEALKGQVESMAQPFEQERTRYAGYATENGWSPDQVVGAAKPADAFGGQQPGIQGVQEGMTATGPNGEKIVLRGGQWVPIR